MPLHHSGRKRFPHSKRRLIDADWTQKVAVGLLRDRNDSSGNQATKLDGVWYGLIECAVHVHRQVVTSRQLAPPVWGPALPQSSNPCSCSRTNCSCLRCKHAACDLRSCSKCTSHNVKNSSVDDRATGFTKSAKWHVCDSAALLSWHVLIAKNAPMLWWYAASKSGHHMLDCPGSSSSEEKPSLAEDPAGDATRATTRDMELRLVRGDAGGDVELGQVHRKPDQNIKQRCCNKKGAGQNGREVGPGATWTRPGTQHFTRNTVETCSAFGVRQESQQHVAQGQQYPRSRSMRAVAEHLLALILSDRESDVIETPASRARGDFSRQVKPTKKQYWRPYRNPVTGQHQTCHMDHICQFFFSFSLI